MRASVLFAVLVVVVWAGSDQILAYLLALTDSKIVTITPFEMLNTRLSITFIVAAMLSLPYVYVEAYRFLSPALYRSERRFIRWSAVPFFVLFGAGVLFALEVFVPVVMVYINHFYVSDVSNSIALASYVSFVLSATFLFGAIFCVPLVLSVLSYMGVINHAILRAYRKHVYIGVLVVGAIITPPDIFTQMLVSLPLVVLYELSVVVSWGIANSKRLTALRFIKPFGSVNTND